MKCFLFCLIGILLCGGVFTTCRSEPLPNALPAVQGGMTAAPVQSPSLTVTPTPSAEDQHSIALAKKLIQAYNAGRLDEVMTMFSDTLSFSDCDYAHKRVVVLKTKQALKQWLQERFADHDRFEIASIHVREDVRGDVLAVSYTQRNSDTLRTFGLRNGLVPPLSTKIVIRADRITAFANASSEDSCRLPPASLQ